MMTPGHLGRRQRRRETVGARLRNLVRARRSGPPRGVLALHFASALVYIFSSSGALWTPAHSDSRAMEDQRKTITLTNAQLERVNAGDIDPVLLLAGQAMILDEKERSTTDTLKTHWKAAMYSLILSTALIMEGYDAVIVSLYQSN